MKLAIISKLWEPTTPLSSGGTGASIGNLVNGLVEKGHNVTLFATGDSKTKAQKLVSVRAKAFTTDYSEVQDYQNIAQGFGMFKQVDLIHSAVEHKSVLFADLVSTPSLHSIRYGEFFEHELKLLKKFKHLNFVANSKAITKLLPFLNWQGVIHNGVDLDTFSYASKPGGYLLYLARITEQKGADLAIQVAKNLNLNLILAGKVARGDQEFFKAKIKPYLDNQQIKYLGEVKGRAKIPLLQKATCLIQANRIFEACSNSILEAMACGTPVVALANGSNQELIKNQETGLVVKQVKDLKPAIAKAVAMNRQACRARAEKHFSLTQMTADYIKLYEKILAS